VSSPVPGGEHTAALLEFAVELARAAGEVTLRAFGGRIAGVAKGDGTPVTDTDQAVERLLRARIRDRFPDHAILGEEFGVDAGHPTGRPQVRWILDPIDGTRSFMAGVPLYGVLVGLEWGGTPLLGVAHFPALSQTVSAAREQGCYLDGTRTGVSSVSRLADAVALNSDPGLVARSPVGAGWTTLSEKVAYTRSWGDAYGHTLVATGRAEIMLDPEDLKPWDAAPLLPILTEAGGRFTSLDGRATIHGGSGLSTNGLLHDDTLATLTGPPTPTP